MHSSSLSSIMANCLSIEEIIYSILFKDLSVMGTVVVFILSGSVVVGTVFGVVIVVGCVVFVVAGCVAFVVVARVVVSVVVVVDVGSFVVVAGCRLHLLRMQRRRLLFSFVTFFRICDFSRSNRSTRRCSCL